MQFQSTITASQLWQRSFQEELPTLRGGMQTGGSTAGARRDAPGAGRSFEAFGAWRDGDSDSPVASQVAPGSSVFDEDIAAPSAEYVDEQAQRGGGRVAPAKRANDQAGGAPFVDAEEQTAARPSRVVGRFPTAASGFLAMHLIQAGNETLTAGAPGRAVKADTRMVRAGKAYLAAANGFVPRRVLLRL